MLDAFQPPAFTRLTAAYRLRILPAGPVLAGRPRTARRTLSLLIFSPSSFLLPLP